MTGAGGYIGSALVKALASQSPGSLVLLDSSERNLFEIQRQVETACPILGSVENAALLDEVFDRFQPEIIFHAAAFKHVGLLEQNPFAAIRNNALGSYTLARAALRHGVSKFVFVSTDKAVHPHSVMGVSKRIAELLTISLSCASCRINAIRLCNVIGSVGSVIPLFLEQLRKGQPLTVTDPDVSRYFLSTKQAVAAILAAGVACCGGNIFLPKLASPVRIVDLAKLLGETAPIRFTGLRPGEKLAEDLIGNGEKQIATIDGPLTVIETRRLANAECEQAMEQLAAAVASRNIHQLLQVLSSLVPDYVPSSLMLKTTLQL
ncbi:MAG: polysaccharide biosynthesis protein [Bryobacteraceae bacterium]